jgi:YD repeat-containing protein
MLLLCMLPPGLSAPAKEAGTSAAELSQPNTEREDSQDEAAAEAEKAPEEKDTEISGSQESAGDSDKQGSAAGSGEDGSVAGEDITSSSSIITVGQSPAAGPAEGKAGSKAETSAAPQSAAPTKFASYGAHTYARYDIPMSWAEAKSYCERLGGHLVTITSWDEQQWVYDTFNETKDIYWIGCSWQNNAWKWVTGEAFSYSKWCTESTDYLNEWCRGVILMDEGFVKIDDGVIYYADAGEWGFCTPILLDINFGFICEWDYQSTPKPDTRPSQETPSKSLWADPIDTSSGAHKIDLTYLTQFGAQSFSFDLSYDSGRLAKGELGKGWYHGYEKKIVEAEGYLRYYTTPSTFVDFTPGEAGIYSNSLPGKQNWTITTVSGGGYLVKLGAAGQEKYNSEGQLTQIINHTGRTLNITRTAQTMTITEPITGKTLLLTYDSQGYVTRVQGAAPSGTGTVSLSYNANRCLAAITDPRGKTASYTYDAQGHVLTGTDGDGIRYFTDSYDSEGRVVEQDDGVEGNLRTRFAYSSPSSEEREVTITDRKRKSLVHKFDSQGRLIREEDQNGNVKSYAYDTQGNIIEETDGNGKKTLRTYNQNNQVLTETDPRGGRTVNTYDSRGNLLTQKNPDGGAMTNSYDANNRLTSSTDTRGKKTTYTYDGNGLLIEKQEGPFNYKTIYAYQNGLVRQITDTRRSVTAYTYTGDGRPATITNANNEQTSITYDQNGNMSAQTDAAGKYTTYTYDSRGNLKNCTSQGKTTAYTYNGNGKVTSLKDVKENETTYAYDGEDRLTQVKGPQGNTVTNSYDPAGRLLTVTDARGSVIRYTYDGAGNVLTVKNPGGGITTNTYDANGNLTAQKDPAGNSTAYSYDPKGNLLSSTSPGGKTTSYTYDAMDLQTSLTTPLGNETHNSFDSLGRQVKTTDPLGHERAYTYDGGGNMLTGADPLGGVASQVYNANGKAVVTTNPNGGIIQRAYDASARIIGERTVSGGTLSYGYNNENLLSSYTNARGQKTDLDYDTASRLRMRSTPEDEIEYSYDNSGDLLNIYKNGTEHITREFDALSRVTKYTDPQGNVIEYSCDAVGNLETITYPDGKEVSYTYDAADRMKTVTDWEGRETSYEYDADGNLVRTERPDGSVLIQRYDDDGRLTYMSDNTSGSKTIIAYNYYYDRNGNIKTEVTGGSERTYTKTDTAYDANGRLTDWKVKYALQPVLIRQSAFSLDAGGNITDADGTPMAYDTNNRLLSCDGEALSYDLDGNMTDGPLGSMTYDSQNRLIETEDHSYAYDAENNRIAVTSNGQTTQYVYDTTGPLSRMLMSTDPEGNNTYCIYGAQGLIGSEDAEGNYTVYHYDYRGSTVALTNEDGDTTDEYTYGPYGENCWTTPGASKPPSFSMESTG